MSKHPFGWSLPPGVSQRDIDTAYGGDPSPEAEHVISLLENMIDDFDEIDEDSTVRGELITYIDQLAEDRNQFKQLLQATLRYLPERGAPPPCTCKTPIDGVVYCELHDACWEEPTLREEIEDAIK